MIYQIPHLVWADYQVYLAMYAPDECHYDSLESALQAHQGTQQREIQRSKHLAKYTPKEISNFTKEDVDHIGSSYFTRPYIPPSFEAWCKKTGKWGVAESANPVEEAPDTGLERCRPVYDQPSTLARRRVEHDACRYLGILEPF